MEAPSESMNWRLVSGAFANNGMGTTPRPRNDFSARSNSSRVNSVVAESLENQNRVLQDLYRHFEVSPQRHDATEFDVQSRTIANSSAFQEHNMLPESVNSTTDFTTGSPFLACNDWDDFLNMSGFFRDNNESLKEQENHGNFSELLKDVGNQPHLSVAMDRRSSDQPDGRSIGTAIADTTESDKFGESVVMGIPSYNACQWHQMQQTQQQQQQAFMMLWSQACLSTALNMMGSGAHNLSSPFGWSLPQGMNFTTGVNPASAGNANLFHQMCPDPQMRKRRLQEMDVDSDVEVRNYKRKPRKGKRVCKTCGTSVTPFWRKDKEDGRPLCNACGLYLAKNKAHRPKALWQDNEKSPFTIN